MKMFQELPNRNNLHIAMMGGSWIAKLTSSGYRSCENKDKSKKCIIYTTGHKSCFNVYIELKQIIGGTSVIEMCSSKAKEAHRSNN